MEEVVHSVKTMPSMLLVWVLVGEVVLNEGLPEVMVKMLPEISVEVLANTVEMTPDESVVVSVEVLSVIISVSM